ncbi:MmgE/PrpD family protein [Caballeronia sp. SEWSISQ10-4 2]|nr:hypothetical protein [Caballeronia sp. SEWSISQ10-4 2]MDN7182627.1 MmgE/PrpD family protein [Caballeronia sp. SEWSISQ10-4 2]
MRPNAEFRARYPRALNARVTIKFEDGRVFSKVHVGFEGGLDNPFTWENHRAFHRMPYQHRSDTPAS